MKTEENIQEIINKATKELLKANGLLFDLDAQSDILMDFIEAQEVKGEG